MEFYVLSLKIVYLGSGEFGLECLNALAGSDHSLELVVSVPPNPAGRGRRPNPTPVARWAKAHSLPLLETDNVNTPETIEKIAACGLDLIVVIAFGQKISEELTNLPPKGSINVHASLLPKYRGAAPINWAIVNGETETGISVITVVKRMDAGQILAQAKTKIGPGETAGGLHDRLAKLSAPVLVETIDKIADGTAAYTEQDHSKATCAHKLKKTNGHLDFSEPADVLERKIRGFWPWPGASANYVSKKTEKSIRVTFALARVVETSNQSGPEPGILDENLNVICGKDVLKIIKIKPAGSALMDFKDFTNGRQTQPGDLFTKIEE